MLQVTKACLRIYFWMQWQLVKSSPQKVKTAGKWVYSDYQVGFPLSLTRMDGWMGITFLQFASGIQVWGKNSQNKSSRSFCPCLSKRVVAWPASLAFALVLPTLLGTECSRHRFSK